VLSVYLSDRIISNIDPGLCDAARLVRRVAQRKKIIAAFKNNIDGNFLN